MTVPAVLLLSGPWFVLKINPSSLGLYIMPTIHTIFGLRVVIYPNDHRPAHVHIIGNGCEAVFNLHCPKGPLELRENYGFPRKDIVRIIAKLAAVLAALCFEWRQIHGHCG